MKAALLSGLVFPGAGHFLVKRFVTGALLLATAIISLYLVIANVMDRAMLIVEKIQTGEVVPDVMTITELVSQQANTPEAQILNVASIVLLVVWLFGIFDSYRVGCLQGTEKRGRVKNNPA